MSDEQVGRFVINKDTDFKTKRKKLSKESFENLENDHRKAYRYFAGEQKTLPDKNLQVIFQFPLHFVGVNNKCYTQKLMI